MEQDWVKIYSTDKEFKAGLVSSVLKDNDIEVVTMNKRDSSYQAFGIIELYIHNADFDKAIEIIVKNEV